MTSDIFPVLYVLNDENYLSLSSSLASYTGIDMVSKSWLHVWKGFTKNASLSLVLWLSRVAQFVLLMLSKNSWGDAVFFSVWAATDCQATRDHGKALSPFDFAMGCSWCIEVTLTLGGVMMPACMLLGYFFAFKEEELFLKSKN